MAGKLVAGRLAAGGCAGAPPVCVQAHFWKVWVKEAAVKGAAAPCWALLELGPGRAAMGASPELDPKREPRPEAGQGPSPQERT